MTNRLDLSTLLGILIAFALVVAAIVMDGSFAAFVNIPSVLIVFLGTLALVVASFSFKEVSKALALCGRTIIYPAAQPSRAASELLKMADEGRRQGVLALQGMAERMSRGSFGRKAFTMVVDGMEAPAIERILLHDMHSRAARHARGIAVLRKGADIAPAMGLIGTLIGLVQMLGNLDDPSTIGPAMAVALLTTMYGAILAFLVFTPLATKLERISENEMLIDELYLKAATSIAAKENPRRLEEVLNSILPAEHRVSYFT